VRKQRLRVRFCMNDVMFLAQGLLLWLVQGLFGAGSSWPIGIVQSAPGVLSPWQQVKQAARQLAWWSLSNRGAC
jgi:hypothetical protein